MMQQLQGRVAGAACVLAICGLMVACAGPGESAPPFRDASLSMQGANELVVAGKSSKAEVLAALGQATVISFNSGFEVWVYRAKSSAPAVTKPELVILFTPSGTVSKIRFRPAYASPQG